jgi:hypothetical protein
LQFASWIAVLLLVLRHESAHGIFESLVEVIVGVLVTHGAFTIA